MDERGAKWITEVNIDHCDDKNASIKADIAVDLSLTAIQLIIPVHFSREVARITGRTVPQWVGTIYRSDRGLTSGIHRTDPCFGISEGVFEEILKKNRHILDSVGQRVATFISGISRMPNLEQAWCDAAYWLHEGLSERLDTIAITKIETAIEVLLGAESSKGSQRRLKEVFKAFYGLEEEQPLISGHPRTTKQFIESIVASRSRILHGTLSTLVPDITENNGPSSRDEIEWLGIDLLTKFTLELDGYMTENSQTDNIGAFLSWKNYLRVHGIQGRWSA